MKTKEKPDQVNIETIDSMWSQFLDRWGRLNETEKKWSQCDPDTRHRLVERVTRITESVINAQDNRDDSASLVALKGDIEEASSLLDQIVGD